MFVLSIAEAAIAYTLQSSASFRGACLTPFALSKAFVKACHDFLGCQHTEILVIAVNREMAIASALLLNTQTRIDNLFGCINANREQLALHIIVCAGSADKRLAFAANTFDGKDAPTITRLAVFINGLRKVTAGVNRCRIE